MQSFREALRNRDFVVTADLPLTSGSSAVDVREAVKTLQTAVDAIQVGDNTSTRPHMAPIAAAAIALQAGLDPIVHMNCRDRNRIALQSDLMGAAALGVTSLIVGRGDKLPAAHKQRIKGVFDIGAQRLLATAQAIGLNERLIPAPGFFPGTHVTVIDPPDDWSASGIDSKVTAGSKFVQTQPCLDIAVLRRYMAALVARKAIENLFVIVQVPLLESLQQLRELQDARRPLLIPRETTDRLEKSGNFPAAAAAICAETLRAVADIPGVSGANVLHCAAPSLVTETVLKAFG